MIDVFQHASHLVPWPRAVWQVRLRRVPMMLSTEIVHHSIVLWRDRTWVAGTLGSSGKSGKQRVSTRGR